MLQKISDSVEKIKVLEDGNITNTNIVTGLGNHDHIPKSTFLLVLQTKHQRELLQKYGNVITMMDSIYRTTKYGFPCFFVTVKTSLGSGRVVATIIPQYETQELVSEGLRIVKEWNSNWSPQFFMTDKSSVELGAIGSLFPSCFRLLCDFHRAQAWERWVNKGTNEVSHSDKETVLAEILKRPCICNYRYIIPLCFTCLYMYYYYVSQ